MGYPSYSHASYLGTSSSLRGLSSTEIFSNDLDKDMNPKGVTIRESRDSDENPESLAIIIGLDVTASMGYIPEAMIKEQLGTLMQGIIKAGIPDPAIMFTAIGDHLTDYAPLQIGQFESGAEELVMWLRKTWLEGCGGGQRKESYSLAWYLASKHTSIDCFEKRNQKGYIFTIGDEGVHEELMRSSLTSIFGSGGEENYTAEQLVKMAQKKYNVYHIHANDGNYPDEPKILSQWKGLLGENFIISQDYTKIADIIVATIKDTMNISDVLVHQSNDEDNVDNAEML